MQKAAALQAALAAACQAYQTMSLPSDQEQFESRHAHAESVQSKRFLETLGSRLGGASVLDVGSGELKTASLLIGAGPGVERYTSIDRDINAEAHVAPIAHKIGRFAHVGLDVACARAHLEDGVYDVLILDIEPHGREIELYDGLLRHMKASHLCILKHVGSIDLFGSAMADRFLGKFLDAKRVHDFFAEVDWNLPFRDIFVIMTVEPGVRGDMKCAGRMRGKVSNWVGSTPRIVKEL